MEGQVHMFSSLDLFSNKSYSVSGISDLTLAVKYITRWNCNLVKPKMDLSL